MRKQFAVWYPLSADERERFVTNGLVVLDTNVLLDLYRMTAETRDDLLALLRLLDDRLWIPHQVGLEFHRNRLDVIFDQEQTGQRLQDAVNQAAVKIHEAVRGLRDHPVIDRAVLQATVDESLKQITGFLERAREAPSLSMKEAMQQDRVLDAVSALLEGKVGGPYADDEQKPAIAEAKKRIEQRRPPGYADAKKEDDHAAGDYILWRQTLDEAKKRQLPVLFVTNDQKEDWYRRVHGLTVGPRVELIAEMESEAGVAFHAQTLIRFIETAPAWLQRPVKDLTVSEVHRLDEIGRAMLKDDTTSQVLHEDILRLVGTTAPPDPTTTEAMRLERHQQELADRVAVLQAEVDSAQRPDGMTSDTGSADPRSYTRALEVQLEASSQMLSRVNDRLRQLRGVD